MPAEYVVGNADISVLSDGGFYADAGVVFGQTPRVLWQKYAGPLDAQHRLSLSLNCQLIRSEGLTILVDAGLGEGSGEIERTPDERRLLSEFESLGLRPQDIDILVNTHLHIEHCGWNLRSEDERRQLTFPRAQIVVSQQEWQGAREPNARTRAAYPTETLQSLENEGRLRLIDGSVHLTTEVQVVPAPGHTAGHLAVLVTSRGRGALIAGEMAQTAVQLERPAWVSAWDTLPEVSLETKKQLLRRAAEEDWYVFVSHLPYPGAGKLEILPRDLFRWSAL